MFIAIQFPIADARPFVPGETYRLLLPDWLDPRPPSDFVRAFGAVTWRARGGVDDWPAEEVFCRAERAIRFVHPDSARVLMPSGARVRPRCAFRRLFSDGRAVTRVEVGLAFRKAHPSPPPLQGADLLSLLALALELPVRIPKERKKKDGGPAAEAAPIRLRDAGPELALRYVRATTARREGNVPAPLGWWVAALQPLMLLEYSTERDFVGLPANATVVPTPAGEHLSLAYLRLREPARGDIGVWLVGVSGTTNRDYLRRLRLQLFRLHAEQQTMRRIFRLIGSKQLPVDEQSEAFQTLQSFLADAISLLAHKTRFGLPQSDILAAAQRYDEAADAGERASLLAALARIRPNLMRNVVGYAGWLEEKAAETSNPTYIIEEVKMTNITNVAGGNLQITNQVVAETITDSFKTVQQSSADEELKAALAKLHEDVKLLIPQLPEDDQEKAAKNLKALTDEAVAKKPDRTWLQVSSEGLIAAAKTVAAMSAPVTTAVQAVLKLVGAVL